MVFSGVSSNASMQNGETSSWGGITDDDTPPVDSGPDIWSYWPGYYWY
jgi:hypothetical protein